MKRDCVARGLAARENASGLERKDVTGLTAHDARMPLQVFTMHRMRCGDWSGEREWRFLRVLL